MGFFKRLFGICDTQPPADPSCFSFQDGAIVVDLSKASELSSPGGAVRLEGEGLPGRVLVFRDTDGSVHALENKCTHGGRRLDPQPGQGRVQCCSVGKTTFDLTGKRLSGSGQEDIRSYEATEEDGRITVKVD